MRRRQWLDDADFLDLLGAANLIPGPTSTELAMHIGHRRAGRAGLIAAGLAFLLPAVVIVGILGWAYVEYGVRPEVGAVMAGIVPVVIAVIAHAGWSIGRMAVRSIRDVALLIGSAAAVVVGLPEIVVLLGTGVVTLAVASGRASIAGFFMGSVPAGAAVAAGTATLPAMLVTFLKIGALLFGSGYVLVAFLRSELVDGLGWLTEQQLLDAVAVGQATPGPLFSTATFIGFILAGPPGAVVATVGIFLPAFVAVALSIPVLQRLRDSRRARAFLDGVNVAAVALIGIVALQLAFVGLRDPVGLVLGVGSLALLVSGAPPGRLIVAGAAIGLIRWALGPP